MFSSIAHISEGENDVIFPLIYVTVFADHGVTFILFGNASRGSHFRIQNNL